MSSKYVTLKPSKMPPKTIAPKAKSEVRLGDKPVVAENKKEDVAADEKEVKAKSGESIDMVRGSSNLPLSKFGLREAKDVAKKIKNQFTRIISSPLDRAIMTADEVWDKNDDVPWMEIVDYLTPWHLGDWEGLPTKDVLKDMHELITDTPDRVRTGRGPKSTHDGESFNSFKKRALKFALYLIETYDPVERVLCVTHYRQVRLLQAWVKAGAMGNMEVDTGIMTAKGDDNPTDLFLLDPMARTFTKVDNAKSKGIYYLRHGSTEWNEQNKGAPTLATTEPGEE